jgi:hypothetical protein
MDADFIPAPGQPNPFTADEIIVYGIHLNALPTPPPVVAQQLWAEVNMESALALRIGVVSAGKVLDETECSIVAAYGYAFEGQCYRLDRPRVLAFEFVPASAAVGCGYDGLDYHMWRVRPARRVIELNFNVGEFEKIILDANLPGKRPPNTYASNMRLVHRGGRLTSD